MCAVWSLFFFSSRRRHTRLQGDWSSDVCSSDLGGDRRLRAHAGLGGGAGRQGPVLLRAAPALFERPGPAERAAGDRHGTQIGRASCRERVKISGQRVAVQKTKDRTAGDTEGTAA